VEITNLGFFRKILPFLNYATWVIYRNLPVITDLIGNQCSSGVFYVNSTNAHYYVWSSTGGVTIVPNGSSVSVTGSNGYLKVKAVAYDCGESQEISKWIGLPPTPIALSNAGDNCQEALYEATFGTEVPLDFSYMWYLDGALVSSGKNLFKYRFRDDNFHTLQVQVANSCGSNSYTTSIQRYCPATFTVYPNPSKDKIHIKFDKTNKNKDIPTKISLSNGLQELKTVSPQNLVFSTIIKEDKIISLELNDLPAGIYWLIVHFEDGLEKRQIQVEK